MISWSAPSAPSSDLKEARRKGRRVRRFSSFVRSVLRSNPGFYRSDFTAKRRKWRGTIPPDCASDHLGVLSIPDSQTSSSGRPRWGRMVGRSGTAEGRWPKAPSAAMIQKSTKNLARTGPCFGESGGIFHVFRWFEPTWKTGNWSDGTGRSVDPSPPRRIFCSWIRLVPSRELSHFGGVPGKILARDERWSKPWSKPWSFRLVSVLWIADPALQPEIRDINIICAMNLEGMNVCFLETTQQGQPSQLRLNTDRANKKHPSASSRAPLQVRIEGQSVKSQWESNWQNRTWLGTILPDLKDEKAFESRRDAET